MKRGRSECVEIGIFSQILGIFGINKIQNGNRTQMKYDTISYWLMGRFFRLVGSILSHDKKIIIEEKGLFKIGWNSHLQPNTGHIWNTEIQLAKVPYF